MTKSAITIKSKRNNGRKQYKGGEHIHIAVTRDFADTATEFFTLCKSYNFNPSDVIRTNIGNWLEKQKKLQEQYTNSEFYQNQIVAEIVEAYPWLRKTLKV